MSDSPRPSHSRRLSRECAFQALYMIHVGGASIEEAIEAALQRVQLSPGAAGFARNIVVGVSEHEQELDSALEPILAHGWTIDRIAISDLLALRIAAWEFLYRPEMPPKVTISQAVDLGKRYGSKDSGAFVNGVLGSMLPKTNKAEWSAPPVEEPWPDEVDIEPLPEKEADESEENQDENPRAGTWVLRKDD